MCVYIQGHLLYESFSQVYVETYLCKLRLNLISLAWSAASCG